MGKDEQGAVPQVKTARGVKLSTSLHLVAGK